MPDIRRLDLNLLVALDALLSERSVSRAAQRLSLRQPTMSGMLKRLRALLGDPLFVRTQHGIRPTPRAEALAPRVRDLIQRAEEIVAGDEFDPAAATSLFRIATTDYMLKAVIAPFLSRVRSSAPGMRIAVLPMAVAELATQLAGGALDLAITIPQLAAPGLPSRRLYRESYVGVAAATHPLRGRTPTLAEFCRHAHVLVSPTGGSFEGPVDDALAAAGARRNVVLSVPSFLALREILLSSALIAVVPSRLFDERDASLRRFALPLDVPSFDVIATWHPRTQRDAAHRWLRESLQRSAAEARGAERLAKTD